MTLKYLEQHAELIEERDYIDGFIYLGTNKYFLLGKEIWCHEFNDNRNRYTGKQNIIRLSEEDYTNVSDEYLSAYVGIKEETINKLREKEKLMSETNK